jgi:hypothetical protein
VQAISLANAPAVVNLQNGVFPVWKLFSRSSEYSLAAAEKISAAKKNAGVLRTHSKLFLLDFNRPDPYR